MKQTALTLELRQDNPNIICRWDEHGVSHHKELSFKMMGTLIEQAVQYEPIFTGLLPPNCLAYAKDKNGQERIALLVEMTFTDIRYHDTLYPHFHCLGFYMCLPLCGGKGSALSRWPWSIKVICGPQQNCSFIPFPMYQRADICVWDAIPCPDATAYIRCPVCRHTLCQCQTTTTIFSGTK